MDTPLQQPAIAAVQSAQGWPHPVDASRGLDLQTTWQLIGQARAVAEEIIELRQQLAEMPQYSEGRAPDWSAVALAAGVPALAVAAVPGLAGGEPRWPAAAIAALAVALAGGATVWLAQRRAAHADGGPRRGASAAAAGAAMAAAGLVVAAAVAWPQALAADAATARWLLVAAAAALLSGWSCASGVAEAAEAAVGRAEGAKQHAMREGCLQRIAELESAAQGLRAAVPAAHRAGRGCLAQFERALAQGGPVAAAPLADGQLLN